MYFVYFLKSLTNGKVYCGYTEKIPEQRLNEHNIGSNTWTRQNGPFKLVYYEKYNCQTDARLRELFYKSGFGRKIRDLIIQSVSASG
ncbi:GIY-YIG nuclease family protein [Patescibacteria group bacterium]